MIPSSVRCVLFDAVGTLIYADPPVASVYARAASRFGLLVDEATAARRFVAAFQAHHATPQDGDWTTTEDAERDRWRAIVAAVVPEIERGDALFEQLWSHFAQPASWRLFDDVCDCWHWLDRRRLLLGVASNFDERLLPVCRGLPPLDQGERVFVSSQIGFRKPAPQFFAAIEKSLSLQSHQCMLIGDDYEADYLAATAAGWHAIHLDRTDDAAALRRHSLASSARRIAGLRSLIALAS